MILGGEVTEDEARGGDHVHGVGRARPCRRRAEGMAHEDSRLSPARLKEARIEEDAQSVAPGWLVDRWTLTLPSRSGREGRIVRPLQLFGPPRRPLPGIS